MKVKGPPPVAHLDHNTGIRMESKARAQPVSYAVFIKKSTPVMKPVSRRTLDWIYSVLLLAIVLLSWGYVIYASTVAARRQLSKEYPDKISGMNENL